MIISGNTAPRVDMASMRYGKVQARRERERDPHSITICLYVPTHLLQ